MEDFIEIIFYVIVLVLSGIGSLMKNKKKNQAQRPQPTENHEESNVETKHDVFDNPNEQTKTSPKTEEAIEENELIRMLREATEAASAQRREAELIREQELRAQEEEEKERQREQERRCKELELQAQREALVRAQKAKMQVKLQNLENSKEKDQQQDVFDFDLLDVDAARQAFIASEIFNKKYC